MQVSTENKMLSHLYSYNEIFHKSPGDNSCR